MAASSDVFPAYFHVLADGEADGDEATLVVPTGGAMRVADVVHCVAAAVAARDPAPVVLIRGQWGGPVRIDSRVVRNPFDMLMVMTTLDPPVGLG